jgi:hypothetical protein
VAERQQRLVELVAQFRGPVNRRTRTPTSHPTECTRR